MILYLHGFRSSPQSYKAQLFAQRMREIGRGDAYLDEALAFCLGENVA